MGKRGPAAKGEYAEKSAVLSTRITSELRRQLESAVKQNGHTLSREIEHRLRKTFEDAGDAVREFGSERNRRLMQMVAIAMKMVTNVDAPEADWLDDPIQFEMVVRIVNGTLEAVRPKASMPRPLEPIEKLHTMSVPAALWLGVQNADASLPFGVSARQHLANIIKAEMGEIALRPKIVFGNAEQLRARADEFDRRDTSKRKRIRKRKSK